MTARPDVRETELVPPPQPTTDGHRPVEPPVEAVETAEPTSPAPSGETSWVVALLVLVAGMFMSVLDISIVNVAIPVMQNDFGVTTEDISWVSTSYSLAEGVIVPASAWLGLRLGLGRAYIVAMIGFAIGSVLCGLAWDLNSMIAFRILQAIPGGVIPVVALTMLYKIVPKDRLGAAMGMYGLGIVFAPAIGPTLGGYLVEYVDWRLIFFINVPIGIVGTIAAMVWLPNFGGGTSRKFDLPGFLAIATGLFALLLGLHEAEDWGWTSYPVLILLTYGVLALALFVVIELEVDHPLLNVRVFASWPFTNSLILIAVISAGLFGVLFYIPQSLQLNQGLGAFETGLLLLPQALVMAVIMPLAGQIYDRVGARWPAVAGLIITAWGTWMLRDLTIDTSHGDLAWILGFRAAGIGLAMMPIMTGGLSALPPHRVDGASAFNTVVQRSSSAIGLAAMTALMTAQQSQGYADRASLVPADPETFGSVLGEYSMYQQLQTRVFDTAFGDLMVVTTVLTAGAVLLALMLPSGKPAPSEGPRVMEG
ncbi:EmrB/QacA subfamily drug resistance transporter [Actinomycetospora succinea]|uniref:EmrB/QacA subfamily drug resistance transporter n=1 Tax=Actinomycetospora succinea TaxID=663603 RepID=A0A4R6V088_9PSEU|nr:DHA2 family efflux MFS transporter permease subunit [Actinomycetospora succinea]TDQ51849.1 EmrB/QacA subfamily drug resistance transporter [Actinomycetospora succinea]